MHSLGEPEFNRIWSIALPKKFNYNLKLIAFSWTNIKNQPSVYHSKAAFFYIHNTSNHILGVLKVAFEEHENSIFAYMNRVHILLGGPRASLYSWFGKTIFKISTKHALSQLWCYTLQKWIGFDPLLKIHKNVFVKKIKITSAPSSSSSSPYKHNLNHSVDTCRSLGKYSSMNYFKTTNSKSCANRIRTFG